MSTTKALSMIADKSTIENKSTTKATPVNFLALPSELRNKIYELCLIHPESLEPWANHLCMRCNNLAIALFRTNKTIHHEASSIFYGQNHFDLTKSTVEGLASFFEEVGRENASYIRHICFNFPNLSDLELGNVTIEEHSNSILVNIQSACTSLSTLTTSLDSTHSVLQRLDALEFPKIALEGLSLVNTLFRAIPSLKEIIVEVYDVGHLEYMRREMKDLMWTVRETVYIEDSGSDGGFEDWERDDYYSDSVFDDYDIDDDSDYWRRAMD